MLFLDLGFSIPPLEIFLPTPLGISFFKNKISLPTLERNGQIAMAKHAVLLLVRF